MRTCLADTGPLVAYLDASDPEHETVAAWLDEYTGLLITTSAVVTEAMHFVAGTREGPERIVQLLELTGARIHDCAQPTQLRKAVALMRKYADTPMDFADASLVLLAEQTSVLDILTLDRRGFSTYRPSRGRAFRLVLDVERGKSPRRDHPPQRPT